MALYDTTAGTGNLEMGSDANNAAAAVWTDRHEGWNSYVDRAYLNGYSTITSTITFVTYTWSCLHTGLKICAWYKAVHVFDLFKEIISCLWKFTKKERKLYHHKIYYNQQL